MKLLKPQKTYTWILILFSLFFVAFGLWSLVRFHTVSAWPLMVACVLLTLILLLWSLPNSSYLLLNEEGLRIRHLFATREHRWEDIQKFWADRRVTGQMGVYYLLNGNRLMQVHSLPDNYGMKPQELAILLNQWHRHINEEMEAQSPSRNNAKGKWERHEQSKSFSYAVGASKS